MDINQTPPHNAEVEQQVLGSILLDPENYDRVTEIVRPRDFYNEQCRVTFEHMGRLRQDSVIDMTTLQQSLKSATAYDTDAWDAGWVAKCTTTVPNASHAVYYADIVHQCSIKRQLADIATALASAAMNGKSPTDAIFEVQHSLADLQRDYIDTAEPHLQSITCKELDETDYRLEYLIDGLLVSGQPCLIAGPKKCLKTNILIDLAISLATAGQFLGYFKVNRVTRVGVLSGESGMAVIQETARRVAKAAGLKLADIEPIIWSSTLPTFDDPRSVGELDRWIRDHGIEFVAVDPAYMSLGESVGDKASNMFVMGPILREVTSACIENGCTLSIAHHFTKSRGQTFEIPELGDEAWSGWGEWARQWLLLNRRIAYDYEYPGQHRLWMAAGGSAGHSGAWGLDIDEGALTAVEGREWEVDVKSVRKVKVEAMEDKSRTKAARLEETENNRLRSILNYLRSLNGEVVSKTTIRSFTSIGSEYLGPLLLVLIKDQTVKHHPDHKFGKTKTDGFSAVQN